MCFCVYWIYLCYINQKGTYNIFGGFVSWAWEKAKRTTSWLASTVTWRRGWLWGPRIEVNIKHLQNIKKANKCIVLESRKSTPLSLIRGSSQSIVSQLQNVICFLKGVHSSHRPMHTMVRSLPVFFRLWTDPTTQDFKVKFPLSFILW